MIVDDTIIRVSILPSIISLASFSGTAYNIHDEGVRFKGVVLLTGLSLCTLFFRAEHEILQTDQRVLVSSEQCRQYVDDFDAS
jgi:hypothetical protein